MKPSAGRPGAFVPPRADANGVFVVQTKKREGLWIAFDRYTDKQSAVSVALRLAAIHCPSRVVDGDGRVVDLGPGT